MIYSFSPQDSCIQESIKVLPARNNKKIIPLEITKEQGEHQQRQLNVAVQ